MVFNLSGPHSNQRYQPNKCDSVDRFELQLLLQLVCSLTEPKFRCGSPDQVGLDVMCVTLQCTLA